MPAAPEIASHLLASAGEIASGKEEVSLGKELFIELYDSTYIGGELARHATPARDSSLCRRR